MPSLTATDPGRTAAIGLTAAGAVGVLLTFIGTVSAFSGIQTLGTSAKLAGADNELGYPSSAFAMALFAAVLAVGVAQLAGAAFPPGWWTALVPVLILGVLFEAWALYLAAMGPGVDWLLLVQLVVMAVALALAIPLVPRGRENTVLGISLVVAAVIGFFAAFRLTVDKVGTFIDPATAPSCNFSVIVQCGKNLSSWQGSLFGFPNPLLGIGGWIAVLLVGIMLLAGLRFARWFWIAFNVGLVGAFALIVWLISQSIFVLGTLCPWCMTTWAVVIPAFWLVTFRNVKDGAIPAGPRVRRVFGSLYGLVPLITLVSYIVVAILAQVRLDLLSYL